MATGTRPSSRPQSLPVSRDGLSGSDNRNKENFPSPSLKKPVPNSTRRSFIPSLVPSTEKLDFFTDSYLADSNASQTSLIPSPHPKPSVPSRPRRKLRPVKSAEEQDAEPRHRATRSEVPAMSPSLSIVSHAKPLGHGSSPMRSTGLSTPPRSRDGSFNESPVETHFSSPPRALTETYERIDQEEDLAATEGEISDPDSEPRQRDGPQMINGHASAKPVLAEIPQLVPRSRGATPTDTRFINLGQRAKDDNLTTASVLSDPTGMSFVNQLSDPNIAQALTPHMLQSAADREALRKIWDSKRPIAFGKANKIHLDDDEPMPLNETSTHPPQRLIAFSKAGKRKLANDLMLRPQHQRTFSDMTDHLKPAAQGATQPVPGDIWHNEDFKRGAMPPNPRVVRAPYFSRTHGFPEKQAKTFTNGNMESSRETGSQPPSSKPGLVDSKSAIGIIDNEAHPGMDANAQSPTQASNVDWMQAADPLPVRHTGSGLLQRSQSRLSDTTEAEISPEKSKRFDIDFTGQSFQVSESPPVRTRSLVQDLSREREIIGLAKRAVTTSRLSQLRARESLERLRQTSQSPVSETGEFPKETAFNDFDSRTNGERPLDTPLMLRRTSLGQNGSRRSSSPSTRPSPNRSQSHELLQRLARSSNSTPRSSTPSDRTTERYVPSEGQNALAPAPQGLNVRDGTSATMEDPVNSSVDTVRATPKVTGAWTDTILPDTVKTIKQNGQRLVYAQTPHVNAGGWIDTPAPTNQLSRLEPVLESTQEVPEELMNGIVKDRSNSNQGSTSDSVPDAGFFNPPPATQSLAKRVLAEVKGKVSDPSSNRSAGGIDDSLVLGNATIQSLENVLDMDETDITILSRLGDESVAQTDTQVLDRLVSKLDRLRTHINDAKTGITKLESQISQPEQPNVPMPQPVPCGTCGQPQTENTQHIHPPQPTSYLPLTLLTVTFPIPVLFRRPLPTSSRRLPHPTPLGWVVLTIWTWYLLECTLAEIYSHPQYASHYVWPDYEEPEFPFVLPTMLLRWSRMDWVYPCLIQPVLKLFTGIVRLLGMWFGYIDGLVDGPRDTIAAAVATATSAMFQHAQEANILGGGVGLGMMNDEYL